MSTFNSAQFAKQAGVSVKTLQRWDRAAGSSLQHEHLATDGFAPGAIEPGAQLCVEDQTSHARNPAGFQSGAKTGPVQPESCARTILYCRRIAEISGGLNFKRPKFSDLVDRIVRSELSTRVIAHKGRLARCGVGLLAHLCETHGCQIVVLNTESLSPKQELVQDWMTIVHSFSPRLYDLRSYHKAIQKAMRDDQGSQDPAQSIA